MRHIVAARTYYTTMSKLQAKYKFGFSATPKRDDGLTPVIHFVTGPKIHTVPKSSLIEHLITPSIVFKETEYYYPLLSTQEYQEMISDLSSNHKRNKLIVDTLNNEYLYNNVILLCTRIEQVNQLTEAIGDSAVSLTSDMTKKARAQAIADLNSRVKKHVVSTYGLFSTGIDIPHLDTLFLCAPIKSEIKIRQSAGRLMRKSPGKTKATIVDFVDKQIELLKYQAAKRKRILNAL